MKKAMWAIAFASLIGTAAALPFMPDRVPMHYDIAGNIDRWGSKYENLIFPVIILAAALCWSLIIRRWETKARTAAEDRARAGAGTNAGVLSIAGVLTTAMFTVMQGFILWSSYRASATGAERAAVDIGKVSVFLMGVVFIVLGNYMTKTRINGTVGFRIRWSMYNDVTWRKSNRFGAVAVMAAGVLAVVLAAVMKNSFAAAMASLGLLVLAAAATAVYAHRVYVRETEAGNGGDE